MVILTHIRDNFANAFFPRWSEWWAAGVLMALGFVLTSNPDLMASSKSNAYQLMLMIFTQETWSAVMKVFAACRLVVLLINGAWRRSPHLRATGAFLSCFFWVQITLSVAHTAGFLFVLAAGVLVLDFVNFIRALRDARIVDYTHAIARKTEGGQV
ncbi:hypothetical protein E2F50_13065 [Rhizobium deserti]|uniref:DUF2127 domain-containing protein n=1 Tax=Rhizobium deserti TaxID=2547961 RepID=A0A4R5UH42_9HYPH|nr:hypothetical protein [Rhizobium deserti]TDK35187.1 hypothetical protein E2F50_13065 [Rhizobium deserti]